VIVALLAPAIIPWVLPWREQPIARELQEVNIVTSREGEGTTLSFSIRRLC